MKDEALTGLFMMFLFVIALFIITSYLYTFFRLKNPPNPDVYEGPKGFQGSRGQIGPAGYAINQGSMGPRGFPGMSTNITTYMLLSGTPNEDLKLFPWSITKGTDIIIYAAKLNTYLNSHYPLSVVYYSNNDVNYGYSVNNNSHYLTLDQYIVSSTKSSTLSGDGSERTSNFSGFDYQIIHTSSELMKDTSLIGNFGYDLELDTTYILIYINNLELTYLNSNNVGLILNADKQTLKGVFYFSFYQII